MRRPKLILALTIGAALGAVSLVARSDVAAPAILARALPETGLREGLGNVIAEDSDLLWRNRPGVAFTIPPTPGSEKHNAGWSGKIDARGFRNSDSPPHDDQRTETFRILFVGDAITFGVHVDDQSTYPAKLLSKLHSKYPGRSFDVVNGAVPGWSWVQGSRFVLREGFKLHPDVIVMAHGSADQGRPVHVTDSEQIWLLRNPAIHALAAASRTLRRTVLLAPVADLLDETAAVPPGSPGCRQDLARPGDCRRVSSPHIELAVHDTHDAARATGVPLILLNLDFFRTPAVQALTRIAVRKNIKLVDIVARFDQAVLFSSLARSEPLGLRDPNVPLVPFGFSGPPEPVGRGARIRFRVQKVPRGSTVSIRGSGLPDGSFRFDETMHDDGLNGDEKSGDAVFSTIIEMPQNCAGLRYNYFIDGQAEFALAPSDEAPERTVSFNRDAEALVETFGERPLMRSEHYPDAWGYDFIASEVLAALETTPAFRRFADLPEMGSRQ